MGEPDIECCTSLCVLFHDECTLTNKIITTEKKALNKKVNTNYILVKWCLLLYSYSNVSWLLAIKWRKEWRKEVQGRWRDHQRGVDDSLVVAVCVSLLHSKQSGRVQNVCYHCEWSDVFRVIQRCSSDSDHFKLSQSSEKISQLIDKSEQKCNKFNVGNFLLVLGLISYKYRINVINWMVLGFGVLVGLSKKFQHPGLSINEYGKLGNKIIVSCSPNFFRKYVSGNWGLFSHYFHHPINQ